MCVAVDIHANMAVCDKTVVRVKYALLPKRAVHLQSHVLLSYPMHRPGQQ